MVERKTIANVPSVVSVNSAGGTVAAANPGRSYFAIQNQGTNPLFLCFGSGATNFGTYHLILKASSAVSDGSGAIFTQQGDVCYTGIITASGTGGTLTYLEY